MSKKKCDVLIVGAGPVGLTLALALARQGISIRIIEKSKSYSVYSKALTLQPRSLELLDIVGVSKIIISQGVCIFSDSIYRNKKLITKIRYDLLESPFPHLVHLAQGEIEKVLDETLFKNYGVRTERGITLIGCKQNEDFAISSIKYENGETEDIISSYLVGCDGHASTVRDLIGSPLKREIGNNYYIMADTKMKNFGLSQNERHMFIMKELTTGVLPMKNDYYRVVILRNKSTIDESVVSKDFTDKTVPLETFEEVLRKIGFSEIKLYDPVWLTRFEPKQGIVENYQQKRIFLAGDSAHVQSPTGARGLNTGIQDAYNLAWKFGLVIKKRSNSSLLESYDEERHPVALQLFKYNNERESIVKKDILSKFLIKIKIYFLKIKKFNKMYSETASELKVNYRNRRYIQLSNIKKSVFSHIFRRNRSIGKILPGDRIPDTMLVSLNNKLYKNLFELFTLDRHILLIICGNFVKKSHLELIFKDLQYFIEKYKHIMDIHFVFNKQPSYDISFSPNCFYWVDLKKKLCNYPFKISYSIIRPDGHMADYHILKKSKTVSFLNEFEKKSVFCHYLENVVGSSAILMGCRLTKRLNLKR